MKLEVFKYKIRKKIYEFLDNTVIYHFQKLFFKPIRSDILIFDDFFPCPLSNFRYIEFNEYLKKYSEEYLKLKEADYQLIKETYEQ